MERPLLTVSQTARLLGIGNTTTRALVASGELKSIRFGRAVRIEPSAIDDLIRLHTGVVSDSTCADTCAEEDLPPAARPAPPRRRRAALITKARSESAAIAPTRAGRPEDAR